MQGARADTGGGGQRTGGGIVELCWSCDDCRPVRCQLTTTSVPKVPTLTVQHRATHPARSGWHAGPAVGGGEAKAERTDSQRWLATMIQAQRTPILRPGTATPARLSNRYGCRDAQPGGLLACLSWRLVQTRRDGASGSDWRCSQGWAQHAPACGSSRPLPEKKSAKRKKNCSKPQINQIDQSRIKCRWK